MASNVVRAPPNGISVLVAGAGIGGMTVALECWRRGCEVRIIERAPKNAPQGDAVQILLTGIRLFDYWPYLKKRNMEIVYPTMASFHHINGERFSGPIDPETLMFTNNTSSHKKEKRTFRHSRPKFASMLEKQLNMIGISVEYCKEVDEYFENEEIAGVKLKNGSLETADVVIAADGARTRSLPLVLGHDVPARSSGSSMFRVAYPVEYALADPVVADRFRLNEDGTSTAELWAGPDTQAVFWRNHEEMMWTVDHPDQGTGDKGWGHRVDVEEALKFTATLPNWPEVADRVIKSTPPGYLVDWRLLWRDARPKWTSPRGRVVQLGDAAHTFLPSSGQGATQAMEDARSLATCLALAGSRNIAEATRVHNLLRFERVSCLQAFGVVNRDARNTNKNQDNEKVKPKFGPWIMDHDPENYVYQNYDEALNHIKTGSPFKNTNTPPNMIYRPWSIDTLCDEYERGEPTILDADWV